MTYEIPLFPLHTVLFPGMPLHLHVFEPRYKIMLRKCLLNNQAFGVVLIKQGQEANGPLPKIYNVGCTAQIIQVDPNQNNTYNLTAFGSERFRITNLQSHLPYLIGEIEAIDYSSTSPTQIQLIQLQNLIIFYLDHISSSNSVEREFNKLNLPNESTSLLNLAASLLQIPPYEKQPLLELQTEEIFFQHLIRLYKREIAVLSNTLGVDEEEAKKAARLN